MACYRTARVTPFLIRKGEGILNGQVLRWPDGAVGVLPNRAWLRGRIDLVTVDHYGFEVHVGLLAFRPTKPVCPPDALPIAALHHPARLVNVYLDIVRMFCG